MVSQKRLEGRGRAEKEKKNNTAMWVILIIMVLSVAGFAFMTGGGGGGSAQEYSEIPLQQFEQQGQIFWGAVKNSEQFIFDTIDGLEENQVMANLADQIKQRNVVTIYIADGFESSDSIYLIEKALRGLKIESVRGSNFTCDSNTLILTNNETYEGDCLYFSAEKGEELSQAEALTYHLVK